MISACVVCMHVQMYAWGYARVYGTRVDAPGPSLLSSYSCCPTSFLSRGLSLGCPATELLWATWLHLLRAGIPRTQHHAWPFCMLWVLQLKSSYLKAYLFSPAMALSTFQSLSRLYTSELKPDNRGTRSVIGWSYLQATIVQKAGKQASSLETSGKVIVFSASLLLSDKTANT